MRLSEIKKILAESRSNGIYFRDVEWAVEAGTARGLAYVSKSGRLYMTYMHPIKNKRLVSLFSMDMENRIGASDTLVVWEGSV